MNKFKSTLIVSLIAASSMLALSQNANAAEVNYQHDNFNRARVAFDNNQFLHERQVREQRIREFRERQAREQRIRELRERQAREHRAYEARHAYYR